MKVVQQHSVSGQGGKDGGYSAHVIATSSVAGADA